MDGDGTTIPKPAPQLEVHGLEALKVLADPLRLRLIDALRRAPATVNTLAVALDMPPKSLYYHIGLLATHGLVNVVDTRLISGILEKTYQATAYLFVYSDLAPGDHADPTGIQVMASSFFTITNEEIVESTHAGLLRPAGPATPIADTLQTSWQLLRLNAAEAETLGQRLQALLDEYKHLGHEPHDDSKSYRLVYTLFPVHRIEDSLP